MFRHAEELLQFKPGMKVAHHHDAHKAAGWDRILFDPPPADLAAALHRVKPLLSQSGRVVLVGTGDSPGFDDSLQILERNAWSVQRHQHLAQGAYFLEASPTDESVQS